MCKVGKYEFGNSILRNYLGQFMRLTLSRVGEQKPSRVYKNSRV